MGDIFGWDKHMESVKQQLLQAQLQHLNMFKALGLSPPPTMNLNGDVAAIAQTSVPFSAEGLRHRERDIRDRKSAGMLQQQRAPVQNLKNGYVAKCGYSIGTFPVAKDNFEDGFGSSLSEPQKAIAPLVLSDINLPDFYEIVD